MLAGVAQRYIVYRRFFAPAHELIEKRKVLAVTSLHLACFHEAV
jgi:hypothetical protein